MSHTKNRYIVLSYSFTNTLGINKICNVYDQYRGSLTLSF